MIRSTEELLPFPARAFACALACALACAARPCVGAAAAVPADPPVYRCGSSYSAQRCDSAGPLNVADPRSAVERAQGQDIARRERRLADQLGSEREARDAMPVIRPLRVRTPCAASAAGRCGALPARRRHARAAGTAASAASAALVAKVPVVPKPAGR